jgi:hypothetical protein
MNVVWDLVPKGTPLHHIVTHAMQKFIFTWCEKGFPAPTGDNYQTICENYPTKNPYVVMEMLPNYIDLRKPFIMDCSEIEIERPFAVPLGMTVPVTNPETGEITNEEVFYIGRLDKIVKHKAHGRLIIEHKTTGWYAKEGGFRSDYIESFSPNSQMDGYIFAGTSLYEGGVKGLFVDAALCHKTVHDKFKYIPIDRSFAALDAWLTETKTYVRRIVDEMNQLEATANANSIQVFPKNTSSCSVYSGCTFRDICRYIPDPRNIGTPSSYRVDKWEPFDLLDIGKIMDKKGD